MIRKIADSRTPRIMMAAPAAAYIAGSELSVKYRAGRDNFAQP